LRETLLGSVARPPGATGPLIAATDAGAKERHAGMGFILTDGRWGMGWRPFFTRIQSGHAELLAVALLLLKGKAPLPEVVFLDSRHAWRYLKAWQRGDTGCMPSGADRMPVGWHAGNSGKAPTLMRLAARVAVLPAIRFECVKGHAGHLLNEAADSLASIALEGNHLSNGAAAQRAGRLVEGFLEQWGNEPLRLSSS